MCACARRGLSGNELWGDIPDSLAQLTQLQQLYVDGNRLTGSIPAWIGDLRALTALYRPTLRVHKEHYASLV